LKRTLIISKSGIRFLIGNKLKHEILLDEIKWVSFDSIRGFRIFIKMKKENEMIIIDHISEKDIKIAYGMMSDFLHEFKNKLNVRKLNKN
jgi:hypothetical protein